jgi:hypothetical protein
VDRGGGDHLDCGHLRDVPGLLKGLLARGEIGGFTVIMVRLAENVALIIGTLGGISCGHTAKLVIDRLVT